MTVFTDSQLLQDLMHWCFARVPGRAARRHRCKLLFQEFDELFSGLRPLVTVAGTSGKGTTCALLEAALRESGMRVGSCLKPHLREFRERIQIQGQPVTNDLLERHTRQVWRQLNAFLDRHGPACHPSLYEALLLIAGSIFREQGVGAAIIEAAVGGNNDASSLLPADLSVVTSVDLDHRAELGETLEEIALDKAGIARPGSMLVVGAAVSESARHVIVDTCAHRGVTCRLASSRSFEVLEESRRGQRIHWEEQGHEYHVQLPFVGSHQVDNLATVWEVLQVLCERGWLTDRNGILAVDQAQLAGRFEFFPGAPAWVVDVAHNPASIAALLATAERLLDSSRTWILLGASEAHDYRQFLELIDRRQLPVGLCEGFPKAVPVARLATCLADGQNPFGMYSAPDAAISAILADPSFRDRTVIVTGSLFLVGQIRAELHTRGIRSRSAS